MVWFTIYDKYIKKKKIFLDFLSKNGIENRPIISGNFLNQPASKLYNFKYNRNDFRNANEIEKRGFFIGLHTNKIKTYEVNRLVKYLLNIGKFL